MRCSALLLWAVAAVAAAEKPLVLHFIGDVNFAARRLPRTPEALAAENPLRAMTERFKTADLVVANGEGLLTRSQLKSYGEERLDIGAPPVWARTYRPAGVHLVGLANNHSWDGTAGDVLDNRAAHLAAGVAVYGTGTTPEEAEAPYVLKGATGRCRLAIVPATLKSNRRPRSGASVAFYEGASGVERLAARVTVLAREGCFVIVSVHWGREVVPTPPKDVVAAAHRLVDAGARVVVGHHPHVLQGVELRNGAAIAYSIGNALFSNRDPDKRRSGVLAVTLTGDSSLTLSELALWPAEIHPGDFTLRPATEKQRTATLARLRTTSAPFGTRVEERDGRLVFTAAR